jgi:hypothetical protein
VDGQLPDDELMALAQGGAAAPAGAPPVVAPPAAVPAPLPAAPPLVPAGTHAVKGTQTVEQLQPSPDMVAGRAAQVQTEQAERKLAGDEAQTAEQRARVEADNAQAIADENARRNAEILAEQQHQADLQQQRNDKWLADLEAIKASKAPAGFDEWPQEKRVRGYLSVALAGLARGSTGGVNVALAQINKQVEDQRKLWTLQQEQRFKALEATHGFNAQLDQQARDVIAQGYARKAMAIDSLGKQADAQLKTLQIPAAQQAGIKAQLGLDKAAADAQMKYGQIVSTKVTDATQFAPGAAGGGGGGGVDRLSKLHAFALKNQGNGNDPLVVAEAERLFPELRAKPEKLQTLVAGAIKAAADAKAGGAGRPPAAYTDILSGEKLPVDPTMTDSRQHNEATAKLKPINTFLATAQKLLATAKHPETPEWAQYVGADASKQGGAAAAITRLRSAYAAAKGESVGEGNSAHLASAIPDPPTKGLFNDARMKVWRRKIQDVVDEMTDLRKEGLANAGVPADVIERVAAGKAATPTGAPAKKPSPVDAAIDAQAARYGL